MNIFKRRERAEENAIPENEETEYSVEKREECVETIANDDDHVLTKLARDPHLIKNAIEKGGNTGSLKKNLELACKIAAKETGYEPELIMQVIKRVEEEDRKKQEKAALDKRRKGN